MIDCYLLLMCRYRLVNDRAGSNPVANAFFLSPFPLLPLLSLLSPCPLLSLLSPCPIGGPEGALGVRPSAREVGRRYVSRHPCHGNGAGYANHNPRVTNHNPRGTVTANRPPLSRRFQFLINFQRQWSHNFHVSVPRVIYYMANLWRSRIRDRGSSTPRRTRSNTCAKRTNDGIVRLGSLSPVCWRSSRDPFIGRSAPHPRPG